MTEKTIETKITTVKVEKRKGSEANATVNKHGETTSAQGGTAEEALSNAVKKQK